SSEGGQMAGFFRAILIFINAVLIPLVLGLAFLAFVWGVFKFFILGGSDSEKQAEGKSLMIYAVAGFVLILSLYGIVNFLTTGLGFDNDTISVPNVPSERQGN
ncbi:pilin, partial [Patescibacteria group bacterium]|nr:pilin [Patescibacteria group bacterium]